MMLNELIRDERIRQGRTQEWVAKEVGSKQESISRFEHGHNFGVSLAYRIAKVLGKEIVFKLV